MRLKRAARRAALVAASLLIAVSLLLLAVLHTPWGRGRIQRLIEEQANRVLNGQLEIGSVAGGVFTGLELSAVEFRQGGATTIRADRLTVRYSALQLVRGDSIIIDRLQISGLTVRGARTPSGALNLGSLLKPRETPSGGGPRRAIDIRDIQIDGGTMTFDSAWGPSWAVLPREIRNIRAALAISTAGGEVRLPVRTFSASGASPQFVVQAFSGVLRFTRDGWMVENGALESAQSRVHFNSRIVTTAGKRHYDLTVSPSDVEFREIARVFPGVRSIDVPANLTVTMSGPQDRLVTVAHLRSAAGTISASLTMDSTVPGWTGKGTAELTGVDVSKWLPTESASAITGHAEFDLLLGLGRHFPRGPFSFAGPRAVYLGYEATDVRARGRLTTDRADIALATGSAYGARFLARGWTGIASPYRFQLAGDATSLDLRRLPSTMSVPRVATSLAFAYHASGRFHDPILVGSATFRASTFLGAAVAEGTTGTLDTSAVPLRYSATGRIADLDLTTVGHALDIATLREPRYAGRVSGGFSVTGEGTGIQDFDLDVSTSAATVTIFGGLLRELDFQGKVLRDSLAGSGSAVVEGVDPALALGMPEYKGALSGRVRLTALDLPRIFSDGARLAVAGLRGTATLDRSRVGTLDIVRGDFSGGLDRGMLTLERASVAGNGIDARGQGTIGLTGGASSFTFDATTQDLAALAPFTPIPLSGGGSVRGSVKGPFEKLLVKGSFTGNDVSAAGANILTVSGDFSGMVPGSRPGDAALDVDLTGALLSVGGWTATSTVAKIAYRGSEVRADLQARLADGRDIRTSGTLVVHADHNEIHLAAARLDLAGAAWEVPADSKDATISWDARSIHVKGLALVASARPTSRLTIAGTLGRVEATGALTVDIADAPLESLGTIVPALALYRGQVSGRATVGGTLARPSVDGRISVTKGGFRQFTFDALRVNGRWSGEDVEGDLRLDQAAGRWLTIRGTVPANIFSRSGPSRDVNLVIRSSPIDLAVVEGFTAAASNVTGILELDVTATGPSRDPHVTGFVQVTDAAFRVTSTGVRYAKGNARIELAPDAISVDSFRLEDDKGDPLELSGRASTHELRLGEFAIELSATRFEVLQNALGDVDLNGVVTISGTPAAPVISGDLGAHRARLAADRLLQYFDRPYATAPQAAASDPLAAAAVALTRWWDRAALRLRLQATDNLTFRGDNLRFRSGGAAGLGDVNVTFGGDVTLRKVPGGTITLLGVLRTDRGAYTFQGKRFTIDRDGTIRFTGDRTPPLISVSASRLVQGVDIRVALRGSTVAPELELSSSPGLEQTDIISLLLFNVASNELGTEQRETLAIQAAALSSGFIVSPAVSAIGQALGLDFLQIEPSAEAGGASLRLTAGRDVWRGLFVTYSREFGPLEYNEFTAEYSLTRFLRLEANASDASGGRSRANLFRRVERGGIDVLFFFSY